MYNNPNYNQENYNQNPYPNQQAYQPGYEQQKQKNKTALIIVLAIAGITVFGTVAVFLLSTFIAIQNTKVILDSARVQSFVLYVDKALTGAQTQFMYDSNAGVATKNAYYVYDISTDLAMNTNASYGGYILVDATDQNNLKYTISIYNEEMQINNATIIDQMINVDDERIVPFETKPTAKGMCNALNPNIECLDRKGNPIK